MEVLKHQLLNLSNLILAATFCLTPPAMLEGRNPMKVKGLHPLTMTNTFSGCLKPYLTSLWKKSHWSMKADHNKPPERDISPESWYLRPHLCIFSTTTSPAVQSYSVDQCIKERSFLFSLSQMPLCGNSSNQWTVDAPAMCFVKQMAISVAYTALSR